MEQSFKKECFYVGVLFLLCSCFYARAQNETSTETTIQTETRTTTSSTNTKSFPGTRAGIKGGLNVSNFINDEINDKNARLGFHFGVFGQLFSSEGFAVQPEVNYSTKGNKVTTEFGIIDQDTKFNLNYIDIPVLAVFKLGRTVELHVGPYWSYLVGASIDNEGDILNDFRDLDRDNFVKWDYGLVGGIGFNIQNIQIGARYNYGMKEIAASDGARAMLGKDTKNSLGQIYLAVNLAGR
ncbi:MAG TPA: porin family protein [Cyclobacteriaceae bacterium]|nr:porin family protein [Cyclobacteriaceae bacterium]